MGDRAAALAQVDQAEKLRKSGAPGYARLPEAKICYVRGDLMFVFNDLDRALEEMKAAATNSGQLNAANAAHVWLRLGEIYDLKGQRGQAGAGSLSPNHPRGPGFGRGG